MIWLMALGALALVLGLICDYSNFALRKSQPHGGHSRVSPVVLAPLLFNWCGLALLFVAVGSLHFAWLLGGAILLFLLHVFCLRGFAS